MRIHILLTALVGFLYRLSVNQLHLAEMHIFSHETDFIIEGSRAR